MSTPAASRVRTAGARWRAAVLAAALLTAALAAIGQAARPALAADDAAPASQRVLATSVSGPITPVVADHLRELLDRAAANDHEALLITLDTPGGGLAPTRDIVSDLLGAEVPVLLHVAPAGADAGSAGTFVAYAAHLTAMAPATTIGAATPVDLEGAEVGDKIVENTVALGTAIAEARGRDVDFIVEAVRDGRSATADEALEAGAVDLLAADRGELLAAVDGREVETGEQTRTLRTDGAEVVEVGLGGSRAILQLLADPNLAFVLLTLGTLGILYEIASPGVGLGGVIGGVSLVLALFSLSVLPVSWAGAALLLLAAGLFIAELFAPGIGAAAGGGTIALLIGGLFLFEAPSGIALDLWVLLPTVVVAFVLAALAGRLVVRAQRGESRVASDALIGREVTIGHAPDGRPRARVDGTWWWLRPADPDAALPDGARMRVIDRENLELIVAPTGARDPADKE